MYGTDSFLELVYKKKMESNLSLRNCNENELSDLLERKRNKLKDVLRLDYYDEFGFKPIAKKIETTEYDKEVTLDKYDVEILPKLVFPMYILSHKNAEKNKVVLYCDGHNPAGCVATFKKNDEDNKKHTSIPIEMLNQGYTVVVPEFIGYGEMNMKNYEDFGQKAKGFCYANSAYLMMCGLNLAGLRVFQTMKILDLLYNEFTYNDIALYGISGGGLVVTYTCALDKRINAGIIASYGSTYKLSIMGRNHCICNHTDDILSIGEFSEIAALAVPMPILFSDGIKDPLFPLEGNKVAIKEIKEIYTRFGVSGNFVEELFDGGHEPHFDKSIVFLRKFL